MPNLLKIVAARENKLTSHKSKIIHHVSVFHLPLVGLVYFGLTCLFTFPLILQFTSGLPGQLLEDRDQNLWNLWWVKESVLHLKNPFHTDYIYYPDGVSLYFHTLNPLNGLISLPVQLIFGTVIAYNFIVFFSFIMAGVSSYLLLLYLINHPAAAFCASLIFVFAPYHMGTLKGIMQLISVEWLPFYILFLLRATRQPSLIPWKQRWLDIGAAAFFLVLTALTDWYYTMFLIGFTLVYLCWRMLVEPLIYTWETRRNYKLVKINSRFLEAIQSSSPFTDTKLASLQYGNKRLRRLFINILVPTGLIGLLFLLFISPIVLAMFREMATTTYYLPDPNETRNYSADLLAMFVPPTTSTFFGGIGATFLTGLNLSGPLTAQVFLGYLPLGFAILGLIVTRRSRFWGICGLFFAILALGPALRINVAQPGWWMPYALIENLPVIQIMRSPDRFIVITMLCLAVCAGFGLRWLMEWLRLRLRPGPGSATIGIGAIDQPANDRTRLKQSFISAGLAGLLIAELLQIPYPVNTYQVSPFFVQMGQDQADYSLLELPPQAGYWTGANRMAEQTVHHKQIFDGYISREYDHPFQRYTPGFRELTTLKFGEDIILPSQQDFQHRAVLQEWYDAFSYYKVRYIILRLPTTAKQANSVKLDDYRAAIARVAPGSPIYKDSQLEAYALPPLTSRQHQPFIEIGGKNWYEPEPSVLPPGSFHRWSSGQAALNLVWEGPEVKKGDFSITLGSLEGTRQTEIRYDGQVVWSGYIISSIQEIKIPLTVNPGKHEMLIDVQGKAKRPISLGMNKDTRALLFFASNVSFA